MSKDSRPIKRALISVSDKTGLVELASKLVEKGVELISTGGTYKALRESGLAVVEVSDVTQFPEMMDGRVKTLHPKVHGGLLAIRENPEHEASALAHGIAMIDLLVVNLYPFEKVLASGVDDETMIENIDIGGPAMIRAAAKNHADVTVIVDVADYDAFLEHFDAQNGSTLPAFRRHLAQTAFARTGVYDAMIANWFAEKLEISAPNWRAIGGRRTQEMRYGENPHQSAAFYQTAPTRIGVASARQLQGKPLSYNNLNDADAAFECVGEFDPQQQAAAVIVKHANPCGVAQGKDLVSAYQRALACDPVSAFGGILAFNRCLDAATAREAAKIFTEVIIAPEADQAALAILAEKKNLRVLLTGGLPDPRASRLTVKSLAGGILVQNADNAVIDDMKLTVVTRRKPTDAEMADLKFAFRIAKHVKSNAIVYAKDGATVGIGAGQMSRVDSSRIAAWKAGEAARAQSLVESLAKGSVVASDAFFPFADGLMAAVEAGATAAIQPGGSIRDDEVIAAADAAGIAMVFTGTRHFRH